MMKVIGRKPVEVDVYANISIPDFEIEVCAFVGQDDDPAVTANVRLEDMVDELVDAYLIYGSTSMSKKDYGILIGFIDKLEGVKDRLHEALSKVDVEE